MKKPDGEIPTTSFAGQTDLGHTPFAQAAEFEKVLAEMSKRLHYSQNVFKLGEPLVAGTGEIGAIAYAVWHDNLKMRVVAADDSPAAFAQALEAKLMESDHYRERLEQPDDDTAS